MIIKRESYECALPQNIERDCERSALGLYRDSADRSGEIVIYPFMQGRVKFGLITSISSKARLQIPVYASIKPGGANAIDVKFHWDGWPFVLAIAVPALATYAMLLRGVLYLGNPAAHTLAATLIVLVATALLIVLPGVILARWFVDCRRAHRKLAEFLSRLPFAGSRR